MLDVNSLERRYGNFVAVKDVTFTIQKGEIVGLLGHNGAGKTTIMKMLSGFLEPHNGSIEMDSLNLAKQLKQAQLKIGYLPENLPVYPELTVADYLDYAAVLKGLSGDTKTAEIKRALHATDLVEKLFAPISTLSRGFKQRVGVAQAILGRPKLLILDEPTNGLDPTQTDQMRELIREIAKDATVILSTHIMQEVEALCDRVLIIKGGTLAVDEKLENLRHSNQLLVTTSMDEHAMQNALNEIGAIAGVESLNVQAKRFSYRLRVQDGRDSDDTAAMVAATIVKGGHALYRLVSEHPDLESLFREVATATRTEGLHHAA
ncbi:putative ABC transporter ATP-binding protein YxlF [Thalassocella blandensis]|nr:putative ABC transporter ATP-binding protein YxlF [Thalassocella blandensis]